MAALWPDTIVEEANLAFQISALRKVLEDGASGDALIQTVPTRGYRFVGIVTAVGQVAPIVSQPAPRRWWRSPWMWVVVGGTVVADLGALIATGRVRKSELKPASAFILNPQQVQIRKLTDNDDVSDVAISPDGRYVIFVRGDGQNQGLWLRQIDTRTDVRIVAPDGNELRGLTFSPDGALIYFLKSHPKDLTTRSLYSMSILGGAARMLIDDVDGPISFSPDRHKFVYERCTPAGLQIRLARVDADTERQLASIRGACSVSQPGLRWSPDGRTVAVPALLRTEPRRWILAAVSVDGAVRELLASPYRIGRPAWIAGGQALLVPHAEEKFSENQLWTVAFPGGEARRVTDDLTSYDMTLDATPDGREAVSTVISRVSNIWVVPGDDPARAQQVSDRLPLFKAVELVNGRLLSVGFDGRLWSMAPDGSQRMPFSSLRDVNSFVRCGSTVIASAVTTEAVTYVRIDMDGTHATPLISGTLPIGVFCSDTGKSLFYVRQTSPAQGIFKVPLAGGAAVEVGHNLPVGVSWPLGVSPDETQLAFLQNAHGPERPEGWRVAVVRIDDGASVGSWPVQLAASYPQLFRWTREGLAWEFLRTENGAFNVWEQSIAGGEPRQLTRFTSGRIFNFDWSVDGKRLVMTRGSITRDVVLLNLK